MIPVGVRYIIHVLIILLLFVILSCKTSNRHPSVKLNKSKHDKASILLEKINHLNETGKYAEAIPLAKALLELVKKEKGPNHQGVVACLNVLGGLYNSLGDYSKAELNLRRSLELIVKLEGMNSPAVATSLGLLSKVYINLGDFNKAKPLAKEALLIREKTYGKDHFMISTSLNTLGEIHLNLNEYEEAEPLFIRAIEIRKKHQNAHSLLIVINNLARLYYNIQNYESAKMLADTGLELGKNALGNNHIHIAETLNLLGIINAALGDYESAFQYMKDAQIIHLQSIDHMKGFTSEKQKLEFIAKMNKDLYIFLSLIFSELTESPDSIKEGLNIVLKRKGIVLEVQKQFQKALLSGDKKALMTFNKLSEVRSILSKLAFTAPDDTAILSFKDKMHRLKVEKDHLEVQLSTYSNPYTLYLKKADANCFNVASALPRNSALIEIIRIRDFNFNTKVVEKKRWGNETYYGFILKSATPNKVQFVKLGNADYIDSAISSYKKAIKDFGNIEQEEAIEITSRTYRTLFLPIEKKLDGISKIFISPDANLNLLPFEILLQPNERFLVEDFTVNYLTCGRDLLGFQSHSAESQASVIIGNPDFDLDIQKKIQIPDQSDVQDYTYKNTIDSNQLGKMHFEPLLGAEKEALLIADLIGHDNVKLYLGKEATGDIFMQIKNPKFLHIATHGFFLSEDKLDVSQSQNQRGFKKAQKKKIRKEFQIENPLLRAGLAFAGANKVLEGKSHVNGIITAEKILGLRLLGTDMVVLSACETGLGKIKGGEGVFGLRRAFTQAGARSLVMSMWSVPDLETSELMANFYRNIIFGKMNRAQALRQAIVQQIGIVRKRYGMAYPFYWGAFIFMGEY